MDHQRPNFPTERLNFLTERLLECPQMVSRLVYIILATFLLTTAATLIVAPTLSYAEETNGSLSDTYSGDELVNKGGAFFGSVHGTLCHLTFADRAWMWRFTNDAALRPMVISTAETARIL